MNQVFENIQVLGVAFDNINSVLVNNIEHRNFTYIKETKVKIL